MGRQNEKAPFSSYCCLWFAVEYTWRGNRLPLYPQLSSECKQSTNEIGDNQGNKNQNRRSAKKWGRTFRDKDEDNGVINER